MSKKSYAVTIAGGGSTFTPGIALMLLDRSLMHAEALDAAVDAVIEAICDELFGRKG